MGIGAAITTALLVAVVLIMFAIKLPFQLAIWEAFAPELKSSDPATRRWARMGIIFMLIVAAIALALTVIYNPFPSRR